MTTVGSGAPDAGAARGTCFGDVDLAQRQLRAINAFHEARRMAEAAHGAVERTREMRMDAARRLEVSRRQHAALVERTQAQLVASGGRPTGAGARRRVVLAHRNAWLWVVAQVEGSDRVAAMLDAGSDTVLIRQVPPADIAAAVRELVSG